jgi:hypothetical protein
MAETPTAQDLARDVAADLERLERADRLGVLLPWQPCVQRAHLAAARRCVAAEAECARLREIVRSLADRCAGQSELLARRAEREAAIAVADMNWEGCPHDGD